MPPFLICFRISGVTLPALYTAPGTGTKEAERLFVREHSWPPMSNGLLRWLGKWWRTPVLRYSTELG